MVEEIKIGEFEMAGLSMVLYRLQACEENMAYDDDCEILDYKLVYDNGSSVIVEGLEKIREFLNKKKIRFQSINNIDSAYELSKIVSELYDLGKAVDINSKLYQEVAESDGITLSNYPPKVNNNRFEFVVHRSSILYKDHGFFKAIVAEDNLDHIDLEQLG